MRVRYTKRFRFTQGERVWRHLAPLSREEKSSLLLLAPNNNSFMYIESATALSSEGLADVPGSHLTRVELVTDALTASRPPLACS